MNSGQSMLYHLSMAWTEDCTAAVDQFLKDLCNGLRMVQICKNGSLMTTLDGTNGNKIKWTLVGLRRIGALYNWFQTGSKLRLIHTPATLGKLLQTVNSALSADDRIECSLVTPDGEMIRFTEDCVWI